MRDYLYDLVINKKRGLIAELLKIALFLLSFVYIFIITLVKLAYSLRILRSVKFSCKVISVGNITLGGTGKTPFVKMLVKYLTQNGHKVAILIRGYKRKQHNTQYACLAGRQACLSGRQAIHNTQVMGDEGYLLAKDTGVPVLVGGDRIKIGKEALERYRPDIIILDDGFQHWRLRRDLDIVLINALLPFGNGRVIPRGILREPLSALRRADIFVLTKTNLVEDFKKTEDELKKIGPSSLIVESRHQPIRLYDVKGKNFDLSYIKDKEVCIFSAIGDPESFSKMILDLGAKVKFKFEFSDHFDYCLGDLEKIINTCKGLEVELLVTTQKDAVKITAFNIDNTIAILVLEIELSITKNRDEFYRRLSGI